MELFKSEHQSEVSGYQRHLLTAQMPFITTSRQKAIWTFLGHNLKMGCQYTCFHLYPVPHCEITRMEGKVSQGLHMWSRLT